MRYPASLILLALALGCADRPGPTGPADRVRESPTGGVVVERVAGGVRITNETAEPIGQAVWNPEFLGLFGACNTPTDECLTLAPGASITVADADITGIEPGSTRAVVYWWSVESDPKGGFHADIRSVDVDL